MPWKKTWQMPDNREKKDPFFRIWEWLMGDRLLSANISQRTKPLVRSLYSILHSELWTRIMWYCLQSNDTGSTCDHGSESHDWRCFRCKSTGGSVCYTEKKSQAVIPQSQDETYYVSKTTEWFQTQIKRKVTKRKEICSMIIIQTIRVSCEYKSRRWLANNSTSIKISFKKFLHLKANQEPGLKPFHKLRIYKISSSIVDFSMVSRRAWSCNGMCVFLMRKKIKFLSSLTIDSPRILYLIASYLSPFQGMTNASCPNNRKVE